jgi:hypothetical protein
MPFIISGHVIFLSLVYIRSLAIVVEGMKYRTVGMQFPGGTDLTVAGFMFP